MPSTIIPKRAHESRVHSLTELRELARASPALTDEGFVRVLRLCRQVLELSDVELADELRVSRPTVNRWMNEKSSPSLALRTPIVAWIASEASKRLRIVSSEESGTRVSARGRARTGHR